MVMIITQASWEVSILIKKCVFTVFRFSRSVFSVANPTGSLQKHNDTCPVTRDTIMCTVAKAFKAVRSNSSGVFEFHIFIIS
jgi:hypothetical protein